jgi:hypothetical protein
VRKNKVNPKLPLLLGVIPFIAAGTDALLNGDAMMTTANFTLVAANFTAMKSIKKNPLLVNGIILLLNGFMSLYISFNYYEAGKVGLPYAWLIISLINLLASIMLIRKHIKGESKKLV